MAATGGHEIDVGSLIAGTYEITGLVARGGMGAVWAARHVRLPGKRVAIKVLLSEVTATSELYARFRREAEVVSRIGHPNIVEVLDFNTLPGGTPYIVLEYLEGEDLATRLLRGPLPLDAAFWILRQIGSALHAAHRQQVVHRDLKPGNIFLCPSDAGGVVADRVKVLDFGISKIRGAQTQLTADATVMGTPQYMAPEQIQGRIEAIDQRTDVFALGAISYEMLTGQPAFRGQNITEVLYKVSFEAPPPLPSLLPGAPASVVAAVNRALTKDPKGRFPDVPSFVTALTGQPLQVLERAAVTPAEAAAAGADLGWAQTGVAPAAASPSAPAGASSLAQAGTQAAPASVPAGELHARAPLPATALGAGREERGRRLGLWLGVAVAAAAASYGVVRWRSGLGPAAPAPAASAPVPPATAPAPVDAAPPPVAPQAAVPPPEAEEPIPTPPKPPPVTPGARSSRPTTTPRPPAAAETVPAEVASRLDEAERALAANRLADARQLASRTLTERKTSRALGILTRACCQGGDLGTAKAFYRQVSDKAERARALRACQAAGLDLQ